MSERFPGIEWFCDRCNACLSNQNGFDDHRYVWKCTECGHKNSISSDDIYESEDDFTNYKQTVNNMSVHYCDKCGKEMKRTTKCEFYCEKCDNTVFDFSLKYYQEDNVVILKHFWWD